MSTSRIFPNMAANRPTPFFPEVFLPAVVKSDLKEELVNPKLARSKSAAAKSSIFRSIAWLIFSSSSRSSSRDTSKALISSIALKPIS